MNRPPSNSGPSFATADGSAASLRTTLEDFYELTKPRLSFLSVLTAIVGYLAANPARDLPLLACLLIGTSLAAGGAAVLNQWLEREADLRMARTRNRPVPSGRIAPRQALIYGLILSFGGTALLYFGTCPLAGSLAAATIASYVLLYTPLKRLTAWNTIIGAVPGALPPLIGWAAAQSELSTLGWILFAILFFWQMPHFFAIAWTYRDDYQRAGFVMVSGKDPSGHRVALQSLGFTVALVASSLLPWVLGYASPVYGIIALVGAGYILRPAVDFLRRSERSAPARKLFLASIFYLPALLVPLVLDLWLLA